MFTKKPEQEIGGGDPLRTLSDRQVSETTPFGERPPSYAKSSGPSKIVPSIIGEDLMITGNVTSKGEIQVDGEIQGDMQLRLSPARRQVAGDRQRDRRGCRGARPRDRLDPGFARDAAGAVPCRGRYLPSEPRHRAGRVISRASRAVPTIRWPTQEQRTRPRPDAKPTSCAAQSKPPPDSGAACARE